jgi:hypothetical protein
MNDGIGIQIHAHNAQDPSDNIRARIGSFEYGFSTINNERRQCNAAEKETEKNHLHRVQSPPNKLGNDIVGAADCHHQKKKNDTSVIQVRNE